LVTPSSFQPFLLPQEGWFFFRLLFFVRLLLFFRFSSCCYWLFPLLRLLGQFPKSFPYFVCLFIWVVFFSLFSALLFFFPYEYVCPKRPRSFPPLSFPFLVFKIPDFLSLYPNFGCPPSRSSVDSQIFHKNSGIQAFFSSPVFSVLETISYFSVF